MAELGRRIGIAKSTVAGYEAGDREPSLDTVAAIARLLDASADYLLGLSERSRAVPSDPESLSFAGSELHWNGERLTEDELELLLRLLRQAKASKRERPDPNVSSHS